MKSDIYGIPCTTLKGEEAGAIGSAMLTGVAIKKFDSLEQAVTELIQEDETFLPVRNTPSSMLFILKDTKRFIKR